MSHVTAQETILGELKKVLAGEDELTESTSLTATKISETLDLEEHQLINLERCLMEAARIDPPLPLTTVHTTTEDVKLVDGQRIAKGTDFLIDLYALHRDASQYHEPDKFRPERFSKKSNIYLTPGNQQRHKLSWCPFMTGHRQCNGKELAFTNAKTIISLYLAAMPGLAISEPAKYKTAGLPSSVAESKATVDCLTRLPLQI